jgi:pimeloyl-ACP methyl ester carboxylesterase
LLGRLGELDLPVQVIWGEADQIVTPDYGRAYAKAIPMASFTLLPRAGHLPQVEAPRNCSVSSGTRAKPGQEHHE